MEIRLKSQKNPFIPLVSLAGVGAIGFAQWSWLHHQPWIFPMGLSGIGVMLFVLARELSIHGDYLLTFDEDGFLDSRLGIGKIGWSDVDHVNLELNYGHRALSFRIRRADLYLERLAPRRRAQILARRKLGFQRFTVDLRGLDVDPIALRGQISSMLERHAPAKLPEVAPPVSYV